jgi:cytochrome c oxidase assembly protein subunit 15
LRAEGADYKGRANSIKRAFGPGQNGFQDRFMTASSAQQARHLGAVRWWLIVVAALIAIMVLVGGATRLTESGLSIVEWKPVTGTLPPLNEAQWVQAFEGYKAIPQYRELNAGMSLAEFKTIFWWGMEPPPARARHRRVYLLPFLYFLWRGALGAELKRRLWMIFALGALQGAVGWWMVASGLTQRTEVSQYRLATHLMLALIIFASIIWTLRRMTARPQLGYPRAAEGLGGGFARPDFRPALFWAPLVAGLRAGRVYNTWPEIDGAFIPSAARLWFEEPVVAQFVRQHAHCAVRAPHDRLRAAVAGGASRHRRHAVASRRAVIGGAWSLVAAITLQARSASSRCCIRCRSISRWRIRPQPSWC